MSRFLKRAVCTLTATSIAVAGLLAAPLTATASELPAINLVKDVPAKGTPQILDGRVYSIAQVGNTIILGGEFTQVRNNDSDTAIARTNLVAFDATTYQIDPNFAPNANGTVNVVLPTGDGQTVWVGGNFTTIAGQTRKNLVKLKVSDGSLVTTFNTGAVAGQVQDLRLAGNRLFVAGAFTHIANSPQLGLASVNPTTGKFDTFMRLAIAGNHDGGTTGVKKIDINPAGTRLVAMGNFDTVNGLKNHQLFMADISGATATLAPFQTAFYETACSRSFDSYMRDIDFAPDGKFFVVSTTGAYGGAGKACDSTARFETGAGAGASPSWVNNTGGDTTYAVEITDNVVYTGGHARWQNNPFAADRAGQGAVYRPGIAALDPANGLPLSWNPTRDRGVGVFDFMINEQGLWVGSDTTRIGADYLRSRIALLPNGGTTSPKVKTPGLPNDVYAVTSTGINRRGYTGSAFAAAQNVPNGALTANNVRGAFMLNGNLYIAWSNGTFDRRTFDGTTYGSPVTLNTATQNTPVTDWANDASVMTGLFYDNGRLYFTRSGSSTLFYRYFTPESDVIGAQRLTASANVAGIDFSQVKGMFYAGDKLYWSVANGDLRRIDWTQTAQSGKPVAGTNATVSGPTTDGTNWSSPRAMFLFQDSDGDGPASTPVAAFGSDCTSLVCSFDSSASTVDGASITKREWNFGDGKTGEGTSPEHTYEASGTYTVTLTLTSSKGKTATVSHDVQVRRINKEPVAAFTVDCQQLECSFDASGSSDPDGTVEEYRWDFGDGTTGTGKTVTHTFDSADTRSVTLTVKDNDGGSGTTSEDVKTVSAKVAFVAANSTNGNRTTHTASTPGDVAEGDTLLLILTANSSTATVNGPNGWTQVKSGSVDGLQTAVWSKTATGSDAGNGVTVTTSATVKADLTVAAYRVSGGSGASITEAKINTGSGSATELTTPEVSVDQAGAWMVSYWGGKSSSTTTIEVPGSQQKRVDSSGTGSGAVYSALADSGATVAPGTRGGLKAATSAATSRSATISVVIAPQG